MNTKRHRVREQERLRLARWLHDDVGQALTAMKLDVAWLRRRVDRRDVAPELLESRLDKLTRRVDQTLETIQCMAMDLRPTALDNLELTSALEQMVSQFGEDSGISARFHGSVPPNKVASETAASLYRIGCEALTNVARHAAATQVRVALKTRGERLLLTVSDNGNGLRQHQVRAPGSLGIQGMRERAARVGGRLTLSGRPGKGTVVVADVPLHDERTARPPGALSSPISGGGAVA